MIISKFNNKHHFNVQHITPKNNENKKNHMRIIQKRRRVQIKELLIEDIKNDILQSLKASNCQLNVKCKNVYFMN